MHSINKIHRELIQLNLIILTWFFMIFAGLCAYPTGVIADTNAPDEADKISFEISSGELVTDALPVWRTHKQARPLLLIFTNEPFLQPIPEALTEAANALAVRGSNAQLEKDARYFRTSPVLLPSQALSVAINEKFISEITWVLPLKNPESPMDPDLMRQGLVDAGILTTLEATELKKTTGGINGVIRKIPLNISKENDLPATTKPVLVHFDLSYFQSIYINEVKTPIYKLLIQTVNRLKMSNLDIRAITLSFSTEEEGMVKPEFRFLGRELVTLLGSEANTAAEKEIRLKHGEVLTYATFMQSENALKTLQELVDKHPGVAFFHYDIYRFLRAQKKGSEALESLARAIELDHGYNFEYLHLAQAASRKGRPDAALQMLSLAQKAYPDNPFIGLEMVPLLKTLGQTEHAKKLLEKQIKKAWSPVYYPQIPAMLKQRLLELTETDQKEAGRTGTDNPPGSE